MPVRSVALNVQLRIAATRRAYTEEEREGLVELFGGSGVGNLGKVTATEGAHNGNPASVELTVPPLAVLYLKPAEH